MILTLRVVALNDRPLGHPITARFDAAGGTLGRADHNTMALPDPERHISRQQAQVTAVGQGFVIRNVGSANPIAVGNLSLAQGESAPVRDGDALRIGGYLLAAQVGPEDDGDTVLRPAPVVDPFDELSRVAAAAASTPAPHAFPAASLPPLPHVQPVPRLPDDFDPFAPPAVEAPAAAPSAVPPAGGAFDDLIPSMTRGDSLDELFDLAAPSGRDPLAAFLAGGVAQGQDAGASPDPLAMFDAAPASAAPVAMEAPAAWSDDVPALRTAFTPPLAREVRGDPGPPLPASNATSAPARLAPPLPAPDDDRAPAAAVPQDALWSAFCEGAGVRLPPGTRPTPDLMRLVGRVLRTAVDGTVQLMALRATTRHELRADVTMIQSRNNNPLKFSPDGLAALEQMLQPPLRGFMPAPAAMADAMHDLIGHTIGTMAGTRAALQGVLGRFAPDSLERQLAARPAPGPWLPGSRKARLWDLYLQHFESLRDEAQEDFHALFGKAFLEAYQQQVDHLASAAAQRAGSPASAASH